MDNEEIEQVFLAYQLIDTTRSNNVVAFRAFDENYDRLSESGKTMEERLCEDKVEYAQKKGIPESALYWERYDPKTGRVYNN